MINKQVNLRIPKLLYKQSQDVIKEEGFSNLQEFIKDTLRDRIRQRQIEESIRRVKALQGSTGIKKVRVLTKKEREKLAKELTAAKSNKLMSEFIKKLNLTKAEIVK